MTAVVTSWLAAWILFGLLVVGIAVDYVRHPTRDYDAEASHRALMAELDRIADEAASRYRHPTSREQ
jgi:hypothetical protein